MHTSLVTSPFDNINVQSSPDVFHQSFKGENCGKEIYKKK